MRKKVTDELVAVPPRIDHVHAEELRTISDLLDQMPEIEELVLEDLVGNKVDAKKGRPGLTSSQAIRILVVKQMRGFSYNELAFHLSDSKCYRSFCRLPAFGETPKKSTLQANLKKIRFETIEQINRRLLRIADAEGIEKGDKIRVDSTVVESNIHHPTDSSLLFDSVTVLTRTMKRANDIYGVACCDHTKRAKRRNVDIFYAKGKNGRIEPYRELLKVTKKTVACALQAASELEAAAKAAEDAMKKAEATTLATTLRHYGALAQKVVTQTHRRVLRGETVPASEKIVSIHQPHTDIIRKDNRDTFYGHKITLSTGASGIATDCVVQGGNPADSTLATAMVERHIEIYSRPPQEVVFDGGFASQENLSQIKSKEVKSAVFTKGCGLSITDMVEDAGLFEILRNFRAGIEAGISFLKRCFGLRRCLTSGLESFKAWVWAAIISSNVLRLARHRLARAG